MKMTEEMVTSVYKDIGASDLKKIEEESNVDRNLPAMTDDDDNDDDGAGFEGIGAGDFSIPFLVVLQTGSPECKPVQFGGIKDAAAGKICNRATGALFDGEKGIGLCVAITGHRYTHFYQREPDGSSKGFIGLFETNDPLITKLRQEQGRQGRFGKLTWHDADGDPTEIGELYELYALAVPDWDDVSTVSKVNVPLASTKIRSFRDWAALAVDIKYPDLKNGGYKQFPMWRHRYVMTTTLRQKGTNSWFVPRITLMTKHPKDSFIRNDDPICKMAKEFYEIIKSGRVVVDYAKAEDEVSQRDEEDVPF